MLKKISIIYSILFLLMTIVLIVDFFAHRTAFLMFPTTLFSYQFISANAIGFLALALSCARLQKKDENYFTRLVPVYCLVNMFVSLIAASATIHINGISIDSNVVVDIARNIIKFMTYSYMYIIPLLLLSLINPTNAFTGVIKKIGFGAIGVTGLCELILLVGQYFFKTIPDTYSGDPMASLTANGMNAAFIAALIALGVLAFSIIIGFITNYAMESETMEATELDYDELMKRAQYISEAKQNALLGNVNKTNNAIDRSVSEATGAMNVNNQLGADSNVGQVNKNEDLKTMYIEKGIISVGPVVNETVAEEQKKAQLEQAKQMEMMQKMQEEQAKQQAAMQAQLAEQAKQQQQTPQVTTPPAQEMPVVATTPVANTQAQTENK